MGNHCGCITRDDDEDHQMKDRELPRDAARPVNPAVPNIKLGTVHEETLEAPDTMPDTARSDFSGWQPLSTARSTASNPMDSYVSPRSSPRLPETARLNAELGRETLARLKNGNRRFAGMLPTPVATNGHSTGSRCLTLIAHCTPPPVPWDMIFGVDAGEIACTASIADTSTCQEDDSGAAALEFILATQRSPPRRLDQAEEVGSVSGSPCESGVALIVIMETIRSNNDYVGSATERVWLAVLGILRSSDYIRNALRSGRGSLELHAALFDERTGEVHFLEESSDRVNSAINVRSEESRQSTTKGIVPADEGYAMLMFGNLRATKRSVRAHTFAAGTSKCSPFAVVFRSFKVSSEDGPSLEKIFDVAPERVSSISTVVQTDLPRIEVDKDLAKKTERWKTYLCLAEQFLFAYQAPRLILVFGSAPLFLGAFELPYDEAVKVKEAARAQIFEEMKCVLTMSIPIKAGVADGQLLLIGALYHAGPPGTTGEVEWLGQHPEQDELLGKMFLNSASSLDSETALTASSLSLASVDIHLEAGVADRVENVTRRLMDGNSRYRQGTQIAVYDRQAVASPTKNNGLPPQALVLATCASAHCSHPERLFDAQPGELLVYRTCGGIAGRKEGCAINGLNCLVENNPNIPLLIILGDTRDPALLHAFDQGELKVNQLKASNAQMALDQLLPAVSTAMQQNQSNEVALQIAAEHHLNYVLERLLFDSDVIFNLVKSGKMEVICALATSNGVVHFLGGHQDVSRIMKQRAKIERHIKKGIGLCKNRGQQC